MVDTQPAAEIEFLRYYLDQTWQEMRHIELLRTGFVSTVVSITVLAIGFVAQQEFRSSTIPVSLSVVLLGGFGVAAAHRFTHLHDLDQGRLDLWHAYWAELIDSRVISIRDQSHTAVPPSGLLRTRHRHLWYGLCAVCSVGGAGCLVAGLI